MYMMVVGICLKKLGKMYRTAYIFKCIWLNTLLFQYHNYVVVAVMV